MNDPVERLGDLKVLLMGELTRHSAPNFFVAVLLSSFHLRVIEAGAGPRPLSHSLLSILNRRIKGATWADLVVAVGGWALGVSLRLTGLSANALMSDHDGQVFTRPGLVLRCAAGDRF